MAVKRARTRLSLSAEELVLCADTMPSDVAVNGNKLTTNGTEAIANAAIVRDRFITISFGAGSDRFETIAWLALPPGTRHPAPVCVAIYL